ncbi:MAG: hypothetical protein R6U78_09925 [Bacteroidales bacterium]
MIRILLLTAAVFLAAFQVDAQPTIVYPLNSTFAEILAAKEIRRYVYLRTNQLLKIVETSGLPGSGDIILVATDNHPMVKSLRGSINDTAPWSGFIIKSIQSGNRQILVISGYDCQAVVYGAYRFAEHLGISFDLAGDIIPDMKIELDITGFDEIGKPLLEIRGIQPFHDFYQGPDLWSSSDYTAIISQLPKLGMNFIGFHTYPTWAVTEEREFNIRQGPEPTVWIGLQEDINDDGTVNWSYPAYYAHTHRPHRIWGNDTCSTWRFHAGADQLFEHNYFGADIYDSGIPEDMEASNRVFNLSGQMFHKAFSHARNHNVKTALGTELPMGLEPRGPEVGEDWVRVMPPQLQDRLVAGGKDPGDPDVVKEVYRGIFERISRTHPLDYYWLWSWEVWSRWGVSKKQIKAFEKDIRLAHEALLELGSPFQLGLAGWILGTADDPAEFDDVLPKEAPFFGLWDKADGFEELSANRIKWPATWLEEDWGLIQPQLELHRIYQDIHAALEKSCNGMIAKHWRTRVLGASTGGMKDLLWVYGPAGSPMPGELPENRNDWIDSFYLDWARRQFGPEAASSIAGIFASLDKSGDPGNPAAVPVVSGWETEEEDSGNSAPGAVSPDEESTWEEEQHKFDFVADLEALRPSISGAGNRERFDYWLKSMQCLRLMGEYGCVRFQFEEAMYEQYWAEALVHRRKLARLFEQIITLQMEKAVNISDLGEIINLEILNWHQLMKLKWDKQLEQGLGGRIPSDADPVKEYLGEPRIMLTTRQTQIETGDSLDIRVAVMGDHESPVLYWRPLGTGDFQPVELKNCGRWVYRGTISAVEDDFEYYIQVLSGQDTLFYPVTAPSINRTVVVQDTACASCVASDPSFSNQSEDKPADAATGR